TQLQPQGVVFLPYRVDGVVAATSTGNIARFNYCLGCEFFSSAGKVVFTSLHRTVTFKVGLDPYTRVVTGPLIVRAYDAQGNVVASNSVTVTSGAGYSASVTVSTSMPLIAALTVELGPSLPVGPIIGLSELSFDDIPGHPDFALFGP